MHDRRAGPLVGLIAQLLLLAVIAATVGLGAAGWVAGVACGVGMEALLARALKRAPRDPLGPASWVTIVRATLAVGVAALTADSFARDTPIALFVTLAAVALTLDLIDGWVARRTRTESQLGASFDGEVDAFLLLVLTVYVAPEYGAWVLLIGAARYVFLMSQWPLPWLRAPLPPRRWRKVVTATQGVVLAVAAANVLPRVLTQVLLAVALVLLAASFAECVWWLSGRRDDARMETAGGDGGPTGRGALRSGLAVALTVLASLLVWAAVVAPDQPSRLTLGAFVRLPLELLAVIALAVVLPARPRRVLAVVAGAILSVVVVVKFLDMGFFTAFNRPFRPVDDINYVGIGVETLRDAIGRSGADIAAAVVAVLVLGLLVIPVLALLRVTRVAAGHRGWVLPAAVALGVVWVALRVAGAPVASTSAAALALDEVQAVQSGLQDHKALARQIADDPFQNAPGNRLLPGLRGKDDLLVFAESYGKVAVHGSSSAPGIDNVLRKATGSCRPRASPRAAAISRRRPSAA